MMDKSQLSGQLYVQMMLLLVLFASATLMTVIKFMPSDLLASSLPYMQVAGLSHVVLELALLTGIIATTVYHLRENLDSLVIWVYRTWTVFLILAVLAGLLGQFTGLHFLELPLLFDIALVVLIALCGVIIFQGEGSSTKLILLTGLLLVGICYIIGLVPASNPLTDRILRVVSVNARLFVAYPLLAIAVLHIQNDTLPVERIASAVVIVGSLVSIAPLSAIGLSVIPAIITVPVILAGSLYVLYTISRKTRSWQRIGCILLALSLGGLGTLFSLPQSNSYVLGTQLTTLQIDLALWGVLLVVLGHLNQHIHSEQQTNSLSYWLTVGGIAISSQALLIAGVVQTLLERVMGLGYLDTQSVLVPVYILWIAGSIIWSSGLLVLCLSVFQRQIHISPQPALET